MELNELQRVMEATFGARDRARGMPATVAWLAEEVGELAKAARKGTPEEQLGLSLDDAAERYATGCPRCATTPCRCPM